MYNLLLFLLSLLAQRTNFLYHQLCISIVDILETTHHPTTPAATPSPRCRADVLRF